MDSSLNSTITMLELKSRKFHKLKQISKYPGIGNVSFAKEIKLDEILGVKPGSVTPFGLLNDKNGAVKFFLDEKILISEKMNFHPLTNTSTITLKVGDFIKFFVETNIIVNIFNFEQCSIIKTI